MRLQRTALCVCVIFSLAKPALGKTRPLVEDLTLPWPSGLPAPITRPDGLLLPPLLANEVAKHLEWEDKLPGLCADAVQQEQSRADEAERDKGVPGWVFVGGSLGGVLLGLVGGLLLFHK